jgi:hypothetical protein
MTHGANDSRLRGEVDNVAARPRLFQEGAQDGERRHAPFIYEFRFLAFLGQ